MANVNTKHIPALTDDTNYAEWKREVTFWTHSTTIEAKKQAHTLILAMKGKPRSVAIQMDPEKLAVDTGMKDLLVEMDKMFLQDETQCLIHAIQSFEQYKRPANLPISQYISEFSRLYGNVSTYKSTSETGTAAKTCNCTSYNDGVLAYKLLSQANLTSEKETLLKAIVKPWSYDEMVTTLKRTFGDASNPSVSGTSAFSLPFRSENVNVKQEPVFYTEYEQEPEYDDDRVYYGQERRKK